MDIQKIKKTASDNKNVIIRRTLIIGGTIVGLAIAGAFVLSQVQPDEDAELEASEDGILIITDAE